MKRIENIEKNEWNAFIAANAIDGGLLQSWEWGEFEESEGHKIHRLAWGENNIEACALLVERTLPFGWKYLYCPRGPVSKISDCRFQIADVLRELTAFAKQQHAIFFRIEPTFSFNCQLPTVNCQLTSPVQPNKTLRINIEQSEDELLSQMHQKTRYNIRLAEKSNVNVKRKANLPAARLSSPKSGKAGSEEAVALDVFLKLLSTTTTRDGFHGHTKKHYELLLNHLDAELFVAEHDGQPLAAALVAYCGSTAYYLHGASGNEKRNVMAPYLLHWSIMQKAKQRGCVIYDLWGVDADRWPGVTRFKMGFAPNQPVTEYPGTFDLPISSLKYKLYDLKKKLT